MLSNIYSMSPPEGRVWDSISAATDVLTCVYMPDGLTVQVPVRRDQTAADLLSAACKVGLVTNCREIMTYNTTTILLTVVAEITNKSSHAI